MPRKKKTSEKEPLKLAPEQKEVTKNDLPPKKYLSAAEINALSGSSHKIIVTDLQIEKAKLQKENLELKKTLIESDINNVNRHILDLEAKKKVLIDKSRESTQNIIKAHNIKGGQFGYDPLTGEIAE